MAVSVKTNNNNVDQALKFFKSKVARSGTLSKARERAEGYKKPGVNSRKNNSKKNRDRF